MLSLDARRGQPVFKIVSDPLPHRWVHLITGYLSARNGPWCFRWSALDPPAEWTPRCC